MNGYLIGTLEQVSNGALIFQYAEEWLETSGARPLSLSLPLRKAAYEAVSYTHLTLPTIYSV